MRAWLVALALAGCAPEAPAMADLAPADAATVLDLTATPRPRIGCKNYVKCLLDCGNDQVCGDMCNKDVKTASRTLFNRALRCAQNWCLGADDLGSGDCVLDGTTLKDPPGRMSCTMCLNNATAAFFGQVCDPPLDPNCNPSSCADETAACFDDL